MKTINIADSIGKLLIHDDDVFCETGSSEDEESCRFLQFFHEEDEPRCYLFPKKQGAFMLPVALEMNWQFMQYIKCDQCKEAYQKATK